MVVDVIAPLGSMEDAEGLLPLSVGRGGVSGLSAGGATSSLAGSFGESGS